MSKKNKKINFEDNEIISKESKNNLVNEVIAEEVVNEEVIAEEVVINEVVIAEEVVNEEEIVNEEVIAEEEVIADEVIAEEININLADVVIVKPKKTIESLSRDDYRHYLRTGKIPE